MINYGAHQVEGFDYVQKNNTKCNHILDMSMKKIILTYICINIVNALNK